MTTTIATDDQLDEAIKRAHDSLATHQPDSPEYAKIIDQITKLYAIKKAFITEPVVEEKKESTSIKDWIPVIGSIGGILTIVVFEAAGHIVTSKSLGFVSKLR